MTAVLVVDDDPGLLRTLTLNLRARGYEVQTAPDGRTALAMVQAHPPDLVLLDLGLPDVDGIAVLTRLRSFSPVPVVVLSARHDSNAKVRALDLGADDYMTKPFGMEELLARLRTALRHRAGAVPPTPAVLTTEHLELDLGRRVARRDGEPVHLTPTEWRLLEVLTRDPGSLVRQTDLLREVWGPSYQRETHYLRVYLAQLRRKLEVEPGRPRHFVTEAGAGYRFLP
ncbi:MAG: DNA-binding response regulator [Friedmanniella sp.]|nr:DNA-binding response regulator [Friedmanniella sp.]